MNKKKLLAYLDKEIEEWKDCYLDSDISANIFYVNNLEVLKDKINKGEFDVASHLASIPKKNVGYPAKERGEILEE